MFKFEKMPTGIGAVIKVIGVGGAGGNAVNNMIQANLMGVEFIAANTDATVLKKNLAPTKIHLGQVITKGLGCGGEPEKGYKAALEDVDLIRDTLKGADIVFVTAGMGGGTGTGGAPVISAIAKEEKALTIGVVSTPFSWEGGKRSEIAASGLEQLKNNVDSFIVVNNNRIGEIVDRTVTFKDAFRTVDDVLRQSVQSISDTINVPGIINCDCADIRNIMESRGQAIMGIGIGRGESRERDALEKALKGPMDVDFNLRGAYGVLYVITAGEDLTMDQVAHIGSTIYEFVGNDTKIYVGVATDSRTDDSIQIVLIATGINSRPALPKGFDSDSILRKKQGIAERSGQIRSNDIKLKTILDYTEEYDSPAFLRKQLD
ncbi:MAG: cell division protein FtsZ [Deferribacteraceae bacterium]|nr:cell division protein FtsZ [Deferribacteraceae bacterium]